MDSLDKLPLSELMQVNQICNRYESDCQTATQAIPPIENYLKEVASKYRKVVVYELLPIEMAYRVQARETLTLRSYQKRFPDIRVDRLQSQIDDATASRQHSAGIPDQIGPYRIQKRIAQGGMGTVYQAVHQSMDRKVAIKVLRSEYTHDPHWTERFEREVKATAKLIHPNIVTAYDARKENGLICLVTEWIDGETLES
ncbi:MAG: protein kinase, partial [Planctomycetaceae bacterium]|nr:protein kinase [Planctomycetaceae bacterium]